MLDQAGAPELEAADGESAPAEASGPEIVTVVPTSTVVFAPVIAPPLTRQSGPRVAKLVTMVSWSIVRHVEGSSW